MIRNLRLNIFWGWIKNVLGQDRVLFFQQEKTGVLLSVPFFCSNQQVERLHGGNRFAPLLPYTLVHIGFGENSKCRAKFAMFQNKFETCHKLSPCKTSHIHTSWDRLCPNVPIPSSPFLSHFCDFLGLAGMSPPSQVFSQRLFLI